jgi:hypothetical protein
MIFYFIFYVITRIISIALIKFYEKEEVKIYGNDTTPFEPQEKAVIYFVLFVPILGDVIIAISFFVFIIAWISEVIFNKFLYK